MSVAARILGYVRRPAPAVAGSRLGNSPVPGARPGPATSFTRRASRPVRFAGDFSLQFKPAIEFYQQKVRLPTSSWRDLDRQGHDRAFVVAGATKDALLANLQQAVGDAIAKGERLEEFTRRFEAIVAKHGWTGWTGEGTAAGRAWRARVIYDTNLRTAYAAGRYKQMTDPAIVRIRPYWQYVHGDTRTPAKPRPDHAAWDGLVLMWDDPWWIAHYPPNGWLCSCGVRPLSRRDLSRLGKAGPDPTPQDAGRLVRDPLTGDMVRVPTGVGLGWYYPPGRSWADGLVPHQAPLPPAPGTPAPDLPPLPAIARPITAPVMAEGLPEEAYVDGFLGAFGAARGADRLYRDVAGQAIVISDALFRRGATGRRTLGKGLRATHLLRLAEAIRDPDEIWVEWVADPLRSGMRLVRRYLRHDPHGSGGMVMEWSDTGWAGITAFTPRPDRSLGAPLNDLDVYRSGQPLYRRAGHLTAEGANP